MSDPIDRQAALDAINSYFVNPPEYMRAYADRLLHAVKEDLVDDINNLPTIEPMRKKGRWINGGRIIRCNRCQIGYATVKGMKSALTYKFCPNCGSYNEGDADEDR